MAKRDNLIQGKVAFDYHRNGIGGKGFYSARFVARDESFIAVICPGSDDDGARGECYVLAGQDLLDTGPVRCWRGDDFETELRPRLKEAEARWSINPAIWPIIV